METAINGLQLHSAILIDPHLAQSSSEKLPPAMCGNKYRDPQLDDMQIVRGFGTLILKWYVSLKSLPSGIREPCGRKGRMIEGTSVGEDTKETRPSRHNRTDCELTEMVAWCTGPAQV